MNSVELMARTLDALQDVLEKPAPPPDEVRRILVEVEVDVPMYVTEDRDDGISVELADVSTWRVAPVGPRLDLYLREEIASQIEAEKRAEFEDRVCGDGYDEDDRRSRATP